MKVYTPHIGRDVEIREGTNDFQVWGDTFSGQYHVPPADMPIPRTVLDVGANIGLTAAHYAHLWPDAEIVAVEMDAGNAALARRNAPTARLWECAVAATDGPAYYDPSAQTDAYALGTGTQRIECVALRSVIELSFERMPVEFLKLDVEGMEWSLFAFPEWAPLVRHLLAELHGEGGSDALVCRAIAELEDAGFQASRHHRHPQAVYAYR